MCLYRHWPGRDRQVYLGGGRKQTWGGGGGGEQGLSISDLVFSGGPRDILKFFLGSGPVLDIGLNSAKHESNNESKYIKQCETYLQFTFKQSQHIVNIKYDLFEFYLGKDSKKC